MGSTTDAAALLDPMVLVSTPKSATTISAYNPSAVPSVESTPSGPVQDQGKANGKPAPAPVPLEYQRSPLREGAPEITGIGPEDAFDEGYSMDLSPVRLEGVGMGMRMDEEEMGDEDDTFGFKKGIGK